MPSELGSLRVRSSRASWQWILKSSKLSNQLSFFSSAKRDILGKEHTVVESLADYMPDFLLLLCFTALERSVTVTHTSLADLLRVQK